eukprot:scaffold53344_cov21-Tisochrysis_lutea.AAC.2
MRQITHVQVCMLFLECSVDACQHGASQKGNSAHLPKTDRAHTKPTPPVLELQRTSIPTKLCLSPGKGIKTSINIVCAVLETSELYPVWCSAYLKNVECRWVKEVEGHKVENICIGWTLCQRWVLDPSFILLSCNSPRRLHSRQGSHTSKPSPLCASAASGSLCAPCAHVWAWWP